MNGQGKGGILEGGKRTCLEHFGGSDQSPVAQREVTIVGMRVV